MPDPMLLTIFFALVDSGIVAKLTPAGAKVLLVLVAHFDWRTLRCYPGLNRIQALTGMTRQGVAKGITNLTNRGVIAVQKGGGRGKQSVYALLSRQENSQPMLTVSGDEKSKPPLTVSQTNGQPPLQKQPTPVEVPILKNTSDEHKEGDADASSQTMPASPARLFDDHQDDKPETHSVQALMALWVSGHAGKGLGAFPAGIRGKTVGLLQTMLADKGYDVIAYAIERWFGCTRQDYGIELFRSRVYGGNSELVRREPATQQDTQAIRNGRKLAEMMHAND